MKLFLYILTFVLIILIFRLTRTIFNIPKSKYRLPIVIMTFALSLIGWMSLPYLAQKLIIGCEIDFIVNKTTYVIGDKIHYFYNLDSGFTVWSKTNLKEGDLICSP